MVLALYGSFKRKRHVSRKCPLYSSEVASSGKHCNLTTQYDKKSTKSEVVAVKKIRPRKDDSSNFERNIEESLKLITTRMDLIEYKLNHLNK